MTITAIVLLATLGGSPALQTDTPRLETRSEVRVITMGGPEGHGPGGLDANEDGVVTREEFSAPVATAFDRMDADHDGRLSTDELAAGHGEGGPGHRVMMMGGPGGPGGHGGPGVHVVTREGGPGGHGAPGVMMFGGPGGPGGPGGDVQVFTFRHNGPEGGPHPGGPGERRVEIRRLGGPEGHGSMDTNNDGKVSEDEFLAPMRQAFQSMDADHDGSLGEGEGHHAPPPPPAAD